MYKFPTVGEGGEVNLLEFLVLGAVPLKAETTPQKIQPIATQKKKIPYVMKNLCAKK